MFAGYPPLWNELVALLGRKSKPLAWAATQSGSAVALIDRFAFSSEGTWSALNWDEIDSGGWNKELNTLRLVTATSQEYQFVLSQPGRLPEVFEERVNASIVFARRIEFGNHKATIAKRRNPTDSDSAGTWRIVAGPGVDTNAPEILAALVRIQEEFE